MEAGCSTLPEVSHAPRLFCLCRVLDFAHGRCSSDSLSIALFRWRLLSSARKGSSSAGSNSGRNGSSTPNSFSCSSCAALMTLPWNSSSTSERGLGFLFSLLGHLPLALQRLHLLLSGLRAGQHGSRFFDSLHVCTVATRDGFNGQPTLNILNGYNLNLGWSSRLFSTAK